ncbi:hypothetical protein KP509_14G031400 [Ceratopteris richardii]|uniref:D-lactate dehydrogenase (cytochrome) n=1 Tax=Ceratopteris richardii TaxID=49495 RepID=A0A8T2T6R7_CERRI|nr:hypothetical protein KP509_14G031400 [Ceratopteris richardii]
MAPLSRFLTRRMLGPFRYFCFSAHVEQSSSPHSVALSDSYSFSSSSFPSSSRWKLNQLWPVSILLTAAAPLVLCHEESNDRHSATHEHDRALPISFLEELKSICGDNRVTLDLDERSSHSKPMSNFYPVINIPDVVVYPRNKNDVIAIVRTCSKYNIPIVPYGGATSIEGQILSPYGGLSMDMSLMKKIVELNVEDMDVVVEPGIGWQELNEFLRPYGLFFPLDPGPGASIGGMCATRCSGSLAVRYGTMKDNVLAVQVVLANGDVVKSANRARKSAAGYDLTKLMIGSEGTLGVFTEITLRLQKIPESSVVAICSFGSVKDAADVAIAIMHSGIQPSRLELLDEVMMNALNQANDLSLPEEPTLMFEFIGTDAYAQEQARHAHKVVKEHEGHSYTVFETPEEKETLWKMRKEILWAYLAIQEKTAALTTDVCVPLSRLAECISRTKEETDASFLMCATLAHAGDGNCHTAIVFDASKEEDVQEANRLITFIVDLALEMEGTCTGEHGVGIGKSKYLEKELGIGSLHAMRKIKNALDPANVMNPGKVLPAQFCS